MRYFVQASPLIGFLFAALFSVGSFAATYYVDRNHPGASDNNPGSEIQPWLTIRKAVDTASAGDRVIVKAGSYPERVVLRRSGGPDQRIRFIAEPRHGVTMRGFSVPGSYIRIEGFRIENVSVPGIRIRGSHIAVIGNAIVNVAAEAIMGDSLNDYPNWPRNIYVADNYTNHTNYGIVAQGFDWLVERNEVHRVYNNGIGGDSDYARFFGSRITFRYNYFHGSTFQDSSGANGIWENGGNDDAHLDGWQSFINRKPYGTVFTDITFNGNILRNFGQGVHWKALDSGSSYRNVQFINNVVMPHRQGERPSRVGMYPYDVKNFIIENNTFIGTSEQAIIVAESDGVSIRNNIFYECKLAYAWDNRTINATDANNLIYKTQIPHNANPNQAIIGVDPGFKDPRRIPGSWLEAFSPEAGWRLVNTRWAHLGAQIPPFANSRILIANNDANWYVDKNSINNKINVLLNDHGYKLKVQSFDDTGVLGNMWLDKRNEIRYTPPIDFVGDETFTYTVEDYSGETATANAQIRVASLPLAPWMNAALALLLGGLVVRVLRRVSSPASEK